MKLPFEKCPVCGGEHKDKVVEKILHGGNHTAILQIKAEVCLHCGERLYAEEVVRLFEPHKRALTPLLAAGLASVYLLCYHPFGEHSP